MTEVRNSQAVAHVNDWGTSRKVALRLVLPCMVLTLLSALDRVNISFAAARMIADLGLSRDLYAAGISCFFLGYLMFQAPFMILLDRIPARFWIGTCVLTWGGVALLMAFVQSPIAFLLLRFVLGLGEAAFAPGMVQYLRRWVVPGSRASAFAWPMLSIPLSIVIGGPVSGWLLAYGHFAGIVGWRWMFLVEALPAVALAGVSFCYFDSYPEQARWLTSSEKMRLAKVLSDDRTIGLAAKAPRPLLADPRIWVASAVWFALLSGSYGLTFWLPLALHELTGFGDEAVGLLSALPWIGVAAGMAIGAWHSDRTGERIAHVAAPAALSGVFLVCAGIGTPGWIALAALIATGFMLGIAQGVFWAGTIGEIGAGLGALGIAAINMVGTLGGLLTPPAIGWLQGLSGSFATSVYALGVMLVLGGGLFRLMPQLGLANLRQWRPQS